MLNFSIKKLSSTALVLSCFATLSFQPVFAMEEDDEFLRACKLSEQQFKEEEERRLKSTQSFEETHRIEEEKLRLQEERELEEAIQKSMGLSNKGQIVEEKKEALTEEVWRKLGACALPDNFGDTYFQMLNLSHLSIDSFEGKEGLLNNGWILEKDLNNEYFYHFIMERKKVNKPIEIIDQVVEEKKEALTKEMWQKLGACALPDNFGDTYLQMFNLSHLSIDSFEGKEGLLNNGWILEKDLNNEYFYHFIMERKKEEIKIPIEFITINQNQMIKKEEIVEKVKENSEKTKFVKFSQDVFTQEIFPQFEQEMKEDQEGTESSMQTVYAFEKNMGMFNNLKKIFEKIHGPLTLEFKDAHLKISSIQELVKKQKGNKFSSDERLTEWSEDKNAIWKNRRPLMGESLQMFVQASRNDDSLIESLVEEQGKNCITGLNGRILMQLTLLLMSQVDAVDKGEMNLFSEKK